MLRRRSLFAAGLLPGAATPATTTLALAALGRRHGGRLGVAMLESASGRVWAHRAAESFPLCSTFKFLAAACVLARVDRGAESLARRVAYGPEALVPYSPATAPQAGAGGLTMAELCAAAVTLSDNTAGNLLLDSFGGPPALTAFARALGDTTTRLDRREPALNDVPPGDARDSTTPLAMLGLMQRTLLGTALAPASRAQLAEWLVASRTGGQRLRAGVPAGWRVGDKTGGGPRNATHDLGVIWPPGRAPVLVAAYYIDAGGSEAERNAVLAEVGRLAAGL